MNFFKGISNLLKTGGMLFIFEVVLSFFSLIIIGLDKETQMIWAVLLTILFLVTVIIFIWLMSASAAYKDFNTRRNNELRIKNGEEVPAYKRMQGYRWFNGYLMGLISVLPLLIIVIIGGFLPLNEAGGNAMTVTANLIYGIFFLPLHLIMDSPSSWYMLYAVVLVPIISGLGYQWKGYKMQMQYLKLTHQID